MKNVEIYPSLLALKESPEIWNQRLAELPCPIAGIHYDIGDGEFVPSFMLKPLDLQYLSKSTKQKAESKKEDFLLPIDVHLMVKKPSEYFDQILGFPEVNAVAFHVECDEDVHGLIQDLKNWGRGKSDPFSVVDDVNSEILRRANEGRRRNIKIGLAILDTTPVDHLDPYLLEIDYIVVMTIKGGYSGTPFIPEILGKIEEISQKIIGLRNIQNRVEDIQPLQIIVDGGINAETLPLCIQAGATGAVMSSALFGGGDVSWLDQYVNPKDRVV